MQAAVIPYAKYADVEVWPPESVVEPVATTAEQYVAYQKKSFRSLTDLLEYGDRRITLAHVTLYLPHPAYFLQYALNPPIEGAGFDFAYYREEFTAHHYVCLRGFSRGERPEGLLAAERERILHDYLGAEVKILFHRPPSMKKLGNYAPKSLEGK